MICVESVKVYPSSIKMQVGKWYYNTVVAISPDDATCPTVKWRSSNSSIASVNESNGYIYGNGVGTAKIYATAQDGSGKSGSCTVTVEPIILVDSITLNKDSISLEAGDSFKLCTTICPTNATNQSLSWSSNNPEVATVSGGVVYAKKKGMAKITASSTDGSKVEDSCYVQVNGEIPVTSVTVNPSSKTMYVGECAYLHTTVCPTNATNQLVAWRSSDTNVAVVNQSSGLITALNPGTANIFATAQDGSNKSGSCMITVSGGIIPVTSINIKLTSVKLQKGTSYKLDYTMEPSNATYPTVLWESSNTDVATVGKDGTVCAKSAGIADIVAYATDGSGIEDTCRVTVTNDILVISIAVSPACKSIVVGESAYLHATVCPENATNKNVFWESANQDVAVVNPNSGLVTAQGPGVTTIYVMAQDGSGKRASCRVTVEAAVPVSSVTVCPTNKTMSVGDSLCLSATVCPANATNKAVRWSSSNPNVATVTASTGCVTTKSEGNATITATTVDGGFTASCTVTVDSREVVNIVKDEKNLNCFEVQFSDGLIWKNFGCGLSDDTFATLGAKNRYSYNCTQLFNLKQLSFIYLVDPLGVAYYVKTFAGDYDANVLETLLVKDDLYEGIFGIKPRFFEVLPGNTIQAYYGTVTRENREKVYSEAEILFGAHTIPNIAALIEFTADVLITICAGMSPTIVAPIVNSLQLLHALFFSSSVKGLTSGAAFSFLDEYISEFGEDELERGASKMLDWANILLNSLDTMSGILTLPDFKNITIYNKVDSWYYNVQFKVKGSDYSMKDIISRYEMNY